MKISKSRKIIYYMVLTAMFTALSFVGTYVSIPFGISKVHLGNFFSIIGGLLCGGLVGGISGALGMGLNDLLSSYGPDTILRTFIVKFIVGFSVGFLFRRFVKKEKKVDYILITLSALTFIIFVTTLVLFIVNGEKTVIGQLTLKNSLVLVILTGVISALYILASIFSTKINKLQKYVLVATSIGCSINILLEFVLKIPLKMLFLNFTFEKAVIYATTSLPSALLTAVITTIFITIIYIPVYFATKNINKLDTLNAYIQDISTFYKKEQK